MLVLRCHGDAVGLNFFSQALAMKFFLKTVLINFSSTSTSLSLKLFSPFVSHLIYGRSLSLKQMHVLKFLLSVRMQRKKKEKKKITHASHAQRLGYCCLLDFCSLWLSGLIQSNSGYSVGAVHSSTGNYDSKSLPVVLYTWHYKVPRAAVT